MDENPCAEVYEQYMVALSGRGAGESEAHRQMLSINSLIQVWHEETETILSLKNIAHDLAHDLDTECPCDTCTAVAAIKLQYK